MTRVSRSVSQGSQRAARREPRAQRAKPQNKNLFETQVQAQPRSPFFGAARNATLKRSATGICRGRRSPFGDRPMADRVFFDNRIEAGARSPRISDSFRGFPVQKLDARKCPKMSEAKKTSQRKARDMMSESSRLSWNRGFWSAACDIGRRPPIGPAMHRKRTPSPCTQGEGRGEGAFPGTPAVRNTTLDSQPPSGSMHEPPTSQKMHPLPIPLPVYRERESAW
jgi:hypothetical protein